MHNNKSLLTGDTPAYSGEGAHREAHASHTRAYPLLGGGRIWHCAPVLIYFWNKIICRLTWEWVEEPRHITWLTALTHCSPPVSRENALSMEGQKVWVLARVTPPEGGSRVHVSPHRAMDAAKSILVTWVSQVFSPQKSRALVSHGGACTGGLRQALSCVRDLVATRPPGHPLEICVS